VKCPRLLTIYLEAHVNARSIGLYTFANAAWYRIVPAVPLTMPASNSNIMNTSSDTSDSDQMPKRDVGP
jgi:hypothetical protein